MPPGARLTVSTPKGSASKLSGHSIGVKGISTDLSAHPRTNPVAALSTLSKLLSSLSRRIGRCQYKLTPAEHVLSLHLVSVLDPFVFQGAKALSSVASAQAKSTFPGIAFQPTEILDSIMAHLDSKRDLLSVALCCKHLYDVVFPRHFDYRVIRCKVSSTSVWNHLLMNTGLARNVRRLDIIDERSISSITPRIATTLTSKSGGLVVPRGITQRETDLETTDDELSMHKKQGRFLASALQCMTELKELRWLSNHYPISIERIWPSLVKRTNTLESIEIFDNQVFSLSSVDGDGSSSGESESEAVPEGLGARVSCSFHSLHGAVLKRR